MTYSKTVWANPGPPYLEAANLNKIETGIAEAHDRFTLRGADADRPAASAATANRLYVVTGGGIYIDTGAELEFVAARTWDQLSGKPTSFSPAAHGHLIGDLPAANDGVSNANLLLRSNDSRLAKGNIGSFKAYQTVAQTDLPHNLASTLTFDTEQWDESGAFAASTFTAPAAGKYWFQGGTFIAPAVDQKLVRLEIWKNGAFEEAIFYGNTSGVIGLGVYGSSQLNLAAGNTVRLACWHNFGTTGTANPDTTPGAQFTYFTGHMLRT